MHHCRRRWSCCTAVAAPRVAYALGSWTCRMCARVLLLRGCFTLLLTDAGVNKSLHLRSTFFFLVYFIPKPTTSHLFHIDAFTPPSSEASAVPNDMATPLSRTRAASAPNTTFPLLVDVGVPFRWATARVPLNETPNVSVRPTVIVKTSAFSPLLCAAGARPLGDTKNGRSS